MTKDLSRYPGTWAERTPEKPAVVMARGGERVTYAELDETANRLSQLFRAHGLRPGDHVAFCMENRAELLPIMWGAHYAGLYYTAISSRLTSDEVAYIVAASGSRVLLSTPYMADKLAGASAARASLDRRLSVGGAIEGFEPFEEAVARYPVIDWFGPVVHEYYGGTEGNGLTYCNSREWLDHEGTVGRPVLEGTRQSPHLTGPF